MAKDHVEYFKALGVDTRLKIIELLKTRGSLCVNEISSTLGITPSAVSQHLKVLKYAGLVKSERKGYWIHYDIDVESMDCCREKISEVCACGCGEVHCFCCVDVDEIDDADKLKAYEKHLKDQIKKVRSRIRELSKE